MPVIEFTDNYLPRLRREAGGGGGFLRRLRRQAHAGREILRRLWGEAGLEALSRRP